MPGPRRILGLRPRFALGVVFLAAIGVAAIAGVFGIPPEIAAPLFLATALGIPLLTCLLLRAFCFGLAFMGVRFACRDCGCTVLRGHESTEDEYAHFSCTACGANPARCRLVLARVRRVHDDR